MNLELKFSPSARHACLFYSSNQELLDRLVLYFKEGLGNNELCFWIIPEGWKVEEAKEALRRVVSDFDHLVEKGQMVVSVSAGIYLKEGIFSASEMLEALVEVEKKSLENGYDGVRGSGDCTWALNNYWFSFFLYEKQLNRITDLYKIRALCSYDTRKLSVDKIIEIGSNHQSCLVRRMGQWDSLEPDHFLSHK